MSAKKKAAESPTHHRRLQREAKDLKDAGWKVRAANLRGYEPPPEIAGRIPDIYATGPGGRTRIIEIELPDTLDQHKDQHSALRRHAGQKPRTDIEVKVARPRK